MLEMTGQQYELPPNNERADAWNSQFLPHWSYSAHSVFCTSFDSMAYMKAGEFWVKVTDTGSRIFRPREKHVRRLIQGTGHTGGKRGSRVGLEWDSGSSRGSRCHLFNEWERQLFSVFSSCFLIIQVSEMKPRMDPVCGVMYLVFWLDYWINSQITL